MMKTILNNFLCAMAICLGVTLTGCVAATPQVSTNPATGQTVTNTLYTVSPALATNAASASVIAGQVAQIAALIPPAAPFAPYIPSATTAILALLTLASGALAAYKNNQATSHSNAAAALASAVLTPASSVQATKDAAMAAAALNGSTAVVAQHLATAASPV